MNKKVAGQLGFLIAILLLLSGMPFTSHILSAGNIHSVYGEVYVDGSLADSELEVILKFPSGNESDITSTGHYVMNFQGHDWETGLFFVKINSIEYIPKDGYGNQMELEIQDDIIGYEVNLSVDTTIPNNPPNPPTNPTPQDGAIDVSISPSLSVEVTDPDADPMDVYFYNGSDHSLIGTDTNVPSGGIASVGWPSLSYDTLYSWYAVANDAIDEATSSTWSFTTESEPITNNPPNPPINPSPYDGETGIDLSPILSVDVSDPDGNFLDVSFFDASDHSLIGQHNGVMSGSTASLEWPGLSYTTTYQWYTKVYDYEYVTTSATWSFTTEAEPIVNNPPNTPTSPSPYDGETGVSINPTLSVDVSDPDGDLLEVRFYNASDSGLIGTDYNVPSGGTASVQWLALSYETTYQWYAVANDGEYDSASPTWIFTTLLDPTVNHPPDKPTNPSPADATTGVSLNPILSVDVYDQDGDNLDVEFYNASDDSLIGEVTGIASGSTASLTWNDLSYSTTYQWYTKVNDSEFDNISATWSFTTRDAIINKPPNAPTNPSPQNGETDVSINPTLSVSVSDPDADMLDVKFYNASDSSLIGIDYNVPSGETAYFVWSGLSTDTTYQWYAAADDSEFQTYSVVWSFTTTVSNPANLPPNAPVNPIPFDGATGVSLNPILSVDVSDPNGNILEVRFYNAFDSSLIGTDYNVPSGGTASVQWLALSYQTTYQWYAVANDGEYDSFSSTWSFTTTIQSSGNNPPNPPTNPSPANGETNVGVNPTLSVDVSDPDGDDLTIYFYDDSDDVLIGTLTNVQSGTTASMIWSGREYSTTYNWYVIADDAQDQSISDRWEFTTMPLSTENLPPYKPSNPLPVNESTDIILSPTLSVDVFDPNDDSINVSFYNADDQTLIGEVNDVASGNSAEIVWSGLSYSTLYRWYAKANDSEYESKSDIWQFTTMEEPPNDPPNKPTNPSPTNYETGIGLNPELSVVVTDPDGDSMDVYFYDASTHQLIKKETNVPNGSTISAVWTGLTYGSEKQWYVIVNDSKSENKSDTWYFTLYDVDLDITFKGGLGISTIFQNYGDGEAEDIEWELSVKTKYLNRINIDKNGIIDFLKPNSKINAKKLYVFGFGLLEVTANAKSGGKNVEKMGGGIIVGYWTLIVPDLTPS